MLHVSCCTFVLLLDKDEEEDDSTRTRTSFLNHPGTRNPELPINLHMVAEPSRLSDPISRDTAILSLRYPISRDTF